MSFSFWFPIMSQYNPLKGVQPTLLWGLCCVWTKSQFLGRIALNSVEGCCHSLHQSELKDYNQSFSSNFPKPPPISHWSWAILKPIGEVHGLYHLGHWNWFHTLSSWAQQGSPCLVSFKPIEQDYIQFRSKGKFNFWPKNEEVQAWTLEYILL